VAWTHNHTDAKAQTLTYFTGPILAAATRTKRAQNFSDMLAQYAGWNINIVAHSEGCATVLAALRQSKWPPIKNLHLICGACDSDCRNNGLNQALGFSIARLHVYVAGKDKAIKLEDTYIGCLCFGLQTGGTPMGLDGPKFQNDSSIQRTTVHRWPVFGHSTCWRRNQFNQTMQIITA
jgi:hypothetical protein